MTNAKYVLSFDPGKSSGVALLSYSETEPVTLVKAWQVERGVVGLIEWVDNYLYWDTRGLEDVRAIYTGEDAFTIHRTISEKFTPLQHKGFNLTMDSMEPARCEGALIALDVMPDYPTPEWRRPVEQYKQGGKNLAEKKKLSVAWLKKHGLDVTGSQVGCKDSNDARSAILHGVNYVATVVKHRPTWEAYYGEL